MGPITEHHLLIFLAQFALLLGACKVVGYFLEKIKQPTITGDVLVGLILGPSIFGKYMPALQGSIFPDEPVQWAMLGTIAWFGNLFLLMETGLEINFTKVWKQRASAIKLSTADLLIPIAISFVPMYFLPARYMVDPSQRFLFALFIAAIMTISALPVAIRGMREMNILKTDVGFLTVSALTMNDLVGWVVFTIILGLFAHGSVEMGYLGSLVGGTLLFTVLSLTVLRRLVDRSIGLIHNNVGKETGYKTTFIVILGMLMGALTLRIGIHSLFGFFIAGIVVGESRFVTEKDRYVLNRMVHSIFVPIFFAKIGLTIDILANLDWFLVGVMLVIGLASRYLAAYLGAAWSGQDRLNRHTIAICHAPGGEMHIVISMLGLSLGVISERVFVSIVTAAIITTIIFGPWLAIALRRINLKRTLIGFNPDAVIIGCPSCDKTGFLKLLSHVVGEQTKLTEDYVYQEIQHREEQITTALGKGIAAPHARLAGIKQSLLFVGKPAQALEWDSPDGEPVHTVFLLLTPVSDPKAQLNIMQCLASSLHKPDLIPKLHYSEEPEQIYRLVSDCLDESETCQLRLEA